MSDTKAKRFRVVIEHPQAKKIRGVKPPRGYLKLEYEMDPDKITPEVIRRWDRLMAYVGKHVIR